MNWMKVRRMRTTRENGTRCLCASCLQFSILSKGSTFHPLKGAWWATAGRLPVSVGLQFCVLSPSLSLPLFIWVLNVHPFSLSVLSISCTLIWFLSLKGKLSPVSCSHVREACAMEWVFMNVIVRANTNHVNIYLISLINLI